MIQIESSYIDKSSISGERALATLASLPTDVVDDLRRVSKMLLNIFDCFFSTKFYSQHCFDSMQANRLVEDQEKVGRNTRIESDETVVDNILHAEVSLNIDKFRSTNFEAHIKIEFAHEQIPVEDAHGSLQNVMIIELYGKKQK